MGAIDAMGTTFNLPNYVGELFAASPEDTPLLSAIGGLTGGESVGSTLFEWQSYDLRDAGDDRQRLEGADASVLTGRTRSNVSNVVEIHQEAVAISYTKQGATRMRGTNGATAPIQLGSATIPADELAWQLDLQIKQIARDVEKTFITGTYANPTNSSNPRKTRGLLEAITTNTVAGTQADDGTLTADPHGITGLTAENVLDLMQKVWEKGGIQESETRTMIVNAGIKRRLSKLFITDKSYQESSRNVGGVNLQTIETDFGRVNIMLNRYMPANKLVVASLEDLKPAFLEIPGKGHFFAEPLAKTGSADKVQIYGEIGLQYGLESHHGELTTTPGDS